MAVKNRTALVYCENQFGRVDGKTAAGLVRHSGTYDIVGVIDSARAGQDAGEALGGENCGIPIFSSLEDALSKLAQIPACYIYGKAPLEAALSKGERDKIIAAMVAGMDIVNGLHQFFTEDREFVHMAELNDIRMIDVRKPPKLKDLHVFTGRISEVSVPVVAVLGTDCACGKRTTAVELDKALKNQGIASVLVATGQSGVMQGARYGVPIDALTSQFVIGEIEFAVVEAFNNENPDIILVEGQSAVSHPAFLGSLGILKGSMPDGVILQHPPGRRYRCDFPTMEIPMIEREIELIQAIAQTKVLAIALSHENLSGEDILDITADYESRLSLPTTDVLSHGCQKLIDALGNRFPRLAQKIRRQQLAEPFVLAA